MEQFVELFSNVANFTWQQLLMIVIGGVLIYLAIKKDMEPTLLLPMGFGAILVNLPFVNTEAIETLFNAGIATELFPLLLFIGIGAMIDFGPLLSNPKMFLFGAAAQFGIFFTFIMARLIGFTLQDAGSIAIIGAADGPTSIYLANYFRSNYQGPIMVAAYSYMALVPIIQPHVIKLITTKRERQIRMPYNPSAVSGTTRVLFPIFVTIVAGTIAPKSAELIGFLMFGNLIRECGVLGSLSDTAQKTLANLVTLLLGISVAFKMKAELFVTVETLAIIGLGLVAFVFDTAGGVLFAKFLNLFLKHSEQLIFGYAAQSVIAAIKTDILWLIESAEHTDLRELGDACQQDELQVTICIFEYTIKAFEDFAVIVFKCLDIAINSGCFNTCSHHIKQWLVIFVNENNNTLTCFLVGCPYKIPESDTKVLGILGIVAIDFFIIR